MAKIKVVKKEKSLQAEMSDDYKQMLDATGACILLKDKPIANYSVMSSYSVKPKRTRGQSKKKKRKK